jgi:hypothetical protein
MAAKITFKHKEYTLNKVTKNIMSVFMLCSDKDKYDWYKEAHNFAIYLSQAYNVQLFVACGVIAALSPVKRWDDNKRIAELFIKSRGKERSHMRQFCEKAQNIMDLALNEEQVYKILNGRKITAFCKNILHPNNGENITIDRHALSIATGIVCTDDFYQGMTKIQYEFFVSAYQKAGEKLNVSPLIVQSATWVYFRNNKTDFK